MAFPLTIQGPYQGWLTPTSTQKCPLGAYMVFPDGRVFRYAQAGAVNLAIGRLMQQAVVTSGHTKDLAVPAAVAVGATAVTITNKTTAITANMYEEGYLFVNDVDGEGQNCKIKSHPAESTGTGSCVITLIDEDALIVALTTSSQVGLRKNPFDDVVVNPTTITGIPVGVTPVAMTALRYGWLQIAGPAAVLTNGTVVLGKQVSPSGTVAGAVDVRPLNSGDTDGQEPPVGYVMSVAADTEFSLVYLTLGR